ncbi:MAG TPA: WG repeat-containing protein, partial [Candidatus Obscuribacterales bacterium]
MNFSINEQASIMKIKSICLGFATIGFVFASNLISQQFPLLHSESILQIQPAQAEQLPSQIFNKIKQEQNTTIPANFDEPFQIKTNQPAILEADKLKIKLINVYSSLCPVGAQCIWAGQVEVVLNVWKNDRDLGRLILINRYDFPDLAVKSLGNKYTFNLIQIKSDNLSDFSKSKQSDYTITLVVSKTIAESRETKTLFTIAKNGKYGYIDKTGRVVIKPQFDGVWELQDGLIKIKVGNKYGYIDKSGQVVIKPQFDDAWNFHEELAAIKIGNKWGYIDKSGQVVIKPQFDGAWEFHEGLAPIKVRNKVGYIDKTGQVVIKPKFDNAFSFNEG